MNKILIVISPSASGKDYIVNHLTSYYNYNTLVSHTTRPTRPKERGGIDYNFISRFEFLNMLNKNEFIEFRTYNTKVDGNSDIWFYGLSKRTVDNLDDDKKYVTIFDVDGAKSFIEYYGKRNCVVCMIKCDDDIREERAKERGGFSQEEWNRRMEDDSIVFSEENVDGLVDYYIENNGTLSELKIKVKDLLDKIDSSVV